jgi:aminodeoxyfutalosine deaminase
MRKIAANLAFDGETYIRNPLIVFDDADKIVELSQFSTNKHEPEMTEFYSGLLVPGFINAHTHLELSVLNKTYQSQKGIADFIQHVISTRKEEDLLQIERMHREVRKMRETGTVAFCDICNSVSSFPAKDDVSVKSLSFFEFLASSKFRVEEQILDMELIKSHYPDFSVFPALHSTYSVSSDALESLRTVFKQATTMSSIHFRECLEETKLTKHDNSLGSLYRELIPEFYPAFPQGRFRDIISSIFPNLKRILLVHNTLISEDDVKEIVEISNTQSIQTGFVLCMRSNWNISGVLPPIDLMQKYDLDLCLGTDSLLSANNLSVFDEIKFVQSRFPNMKFSELLKMATSTPAKVLGWDELGYIQEGKTPGLNLIQMRDLSGNFIPQDAQLFKII